MDVKVIDQRNIQKLGGKATKYPSSYIVYSILSEHDLFGRVLDVTYGQGRFYAYKRPFLLVGADVKVWDWIVVPDFFILRPVWSLKQVLEKVNMEFDVIVCDPPAWNKGVHYNKRDMFSYVVGTSELIIKYAIKLTRELGVRYMLLHYNKVLDNMKIVDNVEFVYVARYLNNPDYRATYFTLYDVGESDNG